MTERLYYDDPMMRRFDAVVTAAAGSDNAWRAALDRTAFYAEAGGQPWDEGVLITPDGEKIQVINVQSDKDGEIWHYLSSPLKAGTPVHGEISWPRRLDHMEQHAGEHLLASALWHKFGGVTQGLHTGHEDVTIDVSLPDGRMHLTREEIIRLEDRVNERIRRNEPIRCYFPSEEELKRLPLRKKPTVTEHVRIVQMGEDEFCPCGGTHPPFTGMIGCVKILSVTPSRGRIRVRFVCGGRALSVFRFYQETVDEAVRIMNAPAASLASACSAALDREKAAQAALEKAAEHELEIKARAAVREARVTGDGCSVICLQADYADPKTLIAQALRLCGEKDRICLCAAHRGEGFFVAAAASENVPVDLRPLFDCPGARGGGRERFVSGQWQYAGSAQDLLGELEAAVLSGKTD